ncbi:hypothetical protein Dimus_036898, partial [Dionaea muscipula]
RRLTTTLTKPTTTFVATIDFDMKPIIINDDLPSFDCDHSDLASIPAREPGGPSCINKTQASAARKGGNSRGGGFFD